MARVAKYRTVAHKHQDGHTSQLNQVFCVTWEMPAGATVACLGQHAALGCTDGSTGTWVADHIGLAVLSQSIRNCVRFTNVFLLQAFTR